MKTKTTHTLRQDKGLRKLGYDPKKLAEEGPRVVRKLLFGTQLAVVECHCVMTHSGEPDTAARFDKCKLHAAAPDMFAALKVIEENGYGGDGADIALNVCRQLARAAIAKAEGK